MRLDFNVLWVEDNQRNVHAQSDRIKLLIRNEGFRLNVEFAASVEEATKFLSDDIYGDHIDLILMDYDLGAGEKGDAGLVAVREIFPYKDIIFYSGMESAKLSQLIADRKVQGVFASHRESLPEVVEGVFENLVKKVLDIDHARGIVMGATSDIDQIVNDLLHEAFEKGAEDFQQASLSAIAERMKDKRASFEKTATAVESILRMKDLFSFHGVYTSDDRLRLLKKLYVQFKLFDPHHDALDRYRDEVMPRRNDLAHITVTTTGFSRTIKDRKGEVITSEDMRCLRVKLLEFHECFEALLDLSRARK
ncbi:hypothetical protein ACQKPT_12895 [Pseudomonas monteilii]|uniref:hypothetical protein n=1 Tax=Pseudomonas monteilii TaxID=76759 RepID=UPI003D044FA3